MFTKVPSELFIFDKSIVLGWEKQKTLGKLIFV